MARTSKTRIGGGAGEQSDRMMRAAESGASLKQRAHEGVLRQHATGSEQAAEMGRTFGGLAEAGARRQEDARQFDEAQQLRSDQLDLSAAESGFRRAGPQDRAAGPQDRAAALDAEMDRGAQQGQGGVGALDPEAQSRLSEQTSQGLEFDGQTWVPTEARKKSEAGKVERERYRDETERIRAEAYRSQTAAQLNAAKLKGDEEEAKKYRSNLLQPIRSDVARFERMQNGKQSDEDWAALSRQAKGFDEPTLQADLQARQWTPRVQAFVNSTIAYRSLQFIGSTGELPDGDMVDLSSPQMQEFTSATGEVAGYMKSMGPEFSQWLGIDSMAKKTSFVNKMAASMVLSGMTAPGSYQPQGAFAGMTPSAGMPPEAGAGPQAMAQEPPVNRGAEAGSFATPDMTERAIEARGRGDHVPPTDSPSFRSEFSRRPEDVRRRGQFSGSRAAEGVL